MSIYRWLKFALVLSSLLAGCGEDITEQLRRENPFLDAENTGPETKEIISCRYIPFQVPGGLDVTGLSVWSQTELQSEIMLPHNGIVSGFAMENVSLWKTNGLSVAVLNPAQAQLLSESIIARGGFQLPVMTAIFHNLSQNAEFDTLWFQEKQSVFLADGQGSLHGYSIANGKCFFRVNCLSLTQNQAVGDAFLKIVPVFRNAETELMISEAEPGFTRQRPELAFDLLTLTGVLRKGYFLAITAAAKDDSVGNMGKVFMTQSGVSQGNQIVLILLPTIQTATEINTQRRR